MCHINYTIKPRSSLRTRGTIYILELGKIRFVLTRFAMQPHSTYICNQSRRSVRGKNNIICYFNCTIKLRSSQQTRSKIYNFDLKYNVSRSNAHRSYAFRQKAHSTDANREEYTLGARTTECTMLTIHAIRLN